MQLLGVCHVAVVVIMPTMRIIFEKFVLSSVTATGDHHTLSAILQSGSDSKELPGMASDPVFVQDAHCK